MGLPCSSCQCVWYRFNCRPGVPRPAHYQQRDFVLTLMPVGLWPFRGFRAYGPVGFWVYGRWDFGSLAFETGHLKFLCEVRSSPSEGGSAGGSAGGRCTKRGRLSRRPLHKAERRQSRRPSQKQGCSAGGRHRKRAAVTGRRYGKRAAVTGGRHKTMPWGRMPQHRCRKRVVVTGAVTRSDRPLKAASVGSTPWGRMP